MRIRLWQLMTLLAIVAIAICLADSYSRKTVLVEFSSPVVWSNPDPALHAENADYSVQFEIHYDQYSVAGFATGKFGANKLLGTNVTPANLSDIDGFSARMSHRYRSLPMLPATTIEDELSKNFDVVLIFPNVEEWQNKMNRR